MTDSLTSVSDDSLTHIGFCVSCAHLSMCKQLVWAKSHWGAWCLLGYVSWTSWYYLKCPGLAVMCHQFPGVMDSYTWPPGTIALLVPPVYCLETSIVPPFGKWTLYWHLEDLLVHLVCLGVPALSQVQECQWTVDSDGSDNSDRSESSGIGDSIDWSDTMLGSVLKIWITSEPHDLCVKAQSHKIRTTKPTSQVWFWSGEYVMFTV